MENASKALIMAGSILIGIIIVSTFVYVFRSSADFAQSYEKTASTVNITKFNDKFEQFSDRTDITIYEIVSLVNYAKNYNKDNSSQIDVVVGNTSYTQLSDSILMDYIKKYQMGQEDEKIYACEKIEYNPDTHYVCLIKFNVRSNKNIV